MKKTTFILFALIIFLFFTLDCCYALFGRKNTADKNVDSEIESYKKKEINDLIDDFYSGQNDSVEKSTSKKASDRKDKNDNDTVNNRIRKQIKNDNLPLQNKKEKFLFCKSCKRKFSVESNRVFCPYDGEKLILKDK